VVKKMLRHSTTTKTLAKTPMLSMKRKNCGGSDEVVENATLKK
jgi:hypothetical protein